MLVVTTLIMVTLSGAPVSTLYTFDSPAYCAQAAEKLALLSNRDTKFICLEGTIVKDKK